MSDITTEAGKRLHDARHLPDYCSDPCELREEVAAIESEARALPPDPELLADCIFSEGFEVRGPDGEWWNSDSVAAAIVAAWPKP